MRRIICWAALLLAALLLALGLHHTAVPDAALPVEGSSAALGLMLLEKERGLYVLAVTKDSPADKAGVEPGDYLLRMEDVTLQDAASLEALLNGDAEVITLTVKRNGRELDVLLVTR